MSYTEKLFRKLNDSEYCNRYMKETFEFEENFPKGKTGIILDDKFELKPGKDGDFENSKALYENLELNETQASDKRLWTYLTHVRFWNYMHSRWPLDGSEKNLDRIKSRYFIDTVNIGTLTRNGISRLWWYSHLTLDRSRKNHYELTDVLLSRQDIVVGIFERTFGSIKEVRTAILEYLRDNPEIKNNEKKTRELLKFINLVGGVKNLSMLKTSDVRIILNKFTFE